MLDYDNSAFYYFALTLLCMYLFPATFYLLKDFYYAFAVSDSGKGRTSAERTKFNKGASGFAKLKKEGNIYIRLGLLLTAWLVFFVILNSLDTDAELSTFDPFHILGIEHGAEDNVIKKAYRKLSLKFHPDKNIGSKVAEEMFMKIAKAYEALTDETSKANYEKYGNPDGKQALEISIGLPRIILDNPKVVLVLYLIGMVICIPLGVAVWYNNSKLFGDKNIQYETYSAFYQMLKETSKMKNMPEILACSAEFRELCEIRDSEKVEISKLAGVMENQKLMLKPVYTREKLPTVFKGNLLVHMHVLRKTNELSPELRKGVDALIAMSPEFIDSMVEIAYQRGWLETTLQCIHFAQHMKQGMFKGQSALHQLPHLSDEAREEIAKESEKKADVLSDYINTPNSEKKGLDKLTAEQKLDVLETCRLLPNRDLSINMFVEEDEDDNEDDEEGEQSDAPDGEVGLDLLAGIHEEDLVTLRITLVNKNMSAIESKENDAIAPYFPTSCKESLWFILTNKVEAGSEMSAVIYAKEKVPVAHKILDKKLKKKEDDSTKQTLQHEMKFMAPKGVGEQEMQLYIFSDTYIGLDQAMPISFSVRSKDELPEYVPHPEDAELDNEPTLFEQVMSANADEADSSDDEDDAPVPAKIAASAKKTNVDDDSESEDSD